MHAEFKKESVYLAELDIHFPELSLGQTLEFVASTRNRRSAPSDASAAARRFDLEASFRTKVGNLTVRGISGGERRRTSIAEAYLSGARFQAWDNSTRGLDSSTAYKLVTLLRETAKVRQATVAMSLYQASDALYRVSERNYKTVSCPLFI
ncbi:hypothetical protein F4808DRAFT_411206 [Astrocystis sublimbata]|nr:hypothetical protein F4808DRAFT_411206 [Astrocystis sublimbata]